MALTWNDTRELAEALFDSQPETHPLSLRFTDLHQWIMSLDHFEDSAEKSTEKHLEAIQMIWYEEWKEEYPDADDPYDFKNRS